jgi:hypothetical protein
MQPVQTVRVGCQKVEFLNIKLPTLFLLTGYYLVRRQKIIFSFSRREALLRAFSFATLELKLFLGKFL